MSIANKPKKVIQMGSEDMPFEPNRFTFDPKKYSVYSNPAEKRETRPGDQFFLNKEALVISETLVRRNTFLTAYRHLRYNKKFKWKALSVFLMLLLPGLLLASIYVLFLR